MQVTATLQPHGAQMKLVWRPRETNVEADDLTNENFALFDSEQRVKVSWDDIPMDFLCESFPLLTRISLKLSLWYVLLRVLRLRVLRNKNWRREPRDEIAWRTECGGHAAPDACRWGDSPGSTCWVMHPAADAHGSVPYCTKKRESPMLFVSDCCWVVRVALAPDPSPQVEEQTTQVLPGGLFRYLSRRGGWALLGTLDVGLWHLVEKFYGCFENLLESDLTWHAVFGEHECVVKHLQV